MADRGPVGTRRQRACQDLRPGVLPRLSWSACLSSCRTPQSVGTAELASSEGPCHGRSLLWAGPSIPRDPGAAHTFWRSQSAD